MFLLIQQGETSSSTPNSRPCSNNSLSRNGHDYFVLKHAYLSWRYKSLIIVCSQNSLRQQPGCAFLVEVAFTVADGQKLKLGGHTILYLLSMLLSQLKG